MNAKNIEKNIRPDYDDIIQSIASYTLNYKIDSEIAWNTASQCLMDALGCGVYALQFEACRKLLGPSIEGTKVPFGSRVIGTNYQLEPTRAAWNLGCLIRWLDYNDTWLAAEWGHPSDNLGGILAVADHLSQKSVANGDKPIFMADILEALIKAYEIQGVLALENSFNAVGLDHVVLVKIASVALIAKLQGANCNQIMAALSHAFADGQALRVYRHAPNTVSRKSWAAGDATSRAVQLVDLVMRGEPGIPSALSAKNWGFYSVSFCEQPFNFSRDFGSYVVENVLFKVSFPAEFHAQTAVEAAIELHDRVKHRVNEIQKIEITTHQSAIRIISKEGELFNPADRDHCLQYMVSAALLFGDLKAEYYEDLFAKSHPEIDYLRNKMEVYEDPRFTDEYYQADKRSIANGVQVFFEDGTHTEKVVVEYPLGHRFRREESKQPLREKFNRHLASCFSSEQQERITSLCTNQTQLLETPVHEFMNAWMKT